ncbi:D-hydantoinase [Geodia barretti]|uniref:dihydropyrimidinase n=1 Tax=Geodia barretti TaxID=519541 RepID=A0AA35TYN9_GEOBA|nr:D-hydantoinase [Geodia barretti]
MFDLLITGGTVVTPSEAAVLDIGVQDGRIAAIAAPGTLTDDATQTLDASGRIVTPGGIEPHAHAAANVRPGAHELVAGVPNAGPLEHSLGAIWGGTTTVVDFAPAPEGELVGGVHDFLSVWNGNTYADYSAHIIYSSRNSADSIARVGELIANDFPSVKIFTTNIRPPSDPPLTLTPIGRIDNGRLADLTAQLARNDGVLAVHAEDDELVMYNYLMARQRDNWDWYNAHLIHSKEVEDLAFRDVIRIAEQNGAGMYFVHVTGNDGVNAVAAARSRGLPVYGEVLTLALSFNCWQYREPDGMKYHTYPSLKYPEDGHDLWSGLLGNNLTFTATDSSFTTYVDKTAGRNVQDMRGGNIGIEIRMGVNYSEAVVKRGMPLTQYANITSTNAARLLGMYPRKGVIAPGSDADFAIIDPSFRKRLTMDDLHLRDYSPWEGWEVSGWPTTVILRGQGHG